MEKFFYFRTVAAIGDDDAQNDSLCIPVSKFKGMYPTSDSELTMWFTNTTREQGGGGINADNGDVVAINLSSDNTHKAVMKRIIDAINEPVSRDNGFIVVADDVTSGDNMAGVASCGGITVRDAYSA